MVSARRRWGMLEATSGSADGRRGSWLRRRLRRRNTPRAGCGGSAGRQALRAIAEL